MRKKDSRCLGTVRGDPLKDQKRLPGTPVDT